MTNVWIVFRTIGFASTVEAVFAYQEKAQACVVKYLAEPDRDRSIGYKVERHKVRGWI